MKKGFTLVEAVVSVAIFLIVAVGVYGAFNLILKTARISYLKTAATALANEQFEIIRNMPYEDVGIVGGVPGGVLEREEIMQNSNIVFTLTRTIRNIDDPFDGVIGGVPNDLSPADYKLVALDICASQMSCLSFTSYLAPDNLEMSGNNGALFIEVFDAVGQPIQGANVSVINNQAIPTIALQDTTNNNGILQIVDTRPGFEAYEITVSKNGYSTEKTYLSAEPQNPNPLKPNATVSAGQLTELSFAIDKVSSVLFSTITETCQKIANVNFVLSGAKLIGQNPDVLKYSQQFSSGSEGEITVDNLEWDTYNIILNSSAYDLAGTISLLPFILNPASNQEIKLVVSANDPMGLLITVKDGSSGLPLSLASVNLQKTDFDKTLITGQGFFRQTNWQGGSGQDDFIEQSKYFSQDGNIETGNPQGELRLKKFFENYALSGQLISSTFDTGVTSDFQQILWQPQSQPTQTGENPVKFQIATNNNKQSWSFLGPDGTSNTFYTAPGENINPIHSGSRYLRYKIFLETASTTYTPNISDIAVTFTSGCVPPGQVLFSGLSAGDYQLTVSKTGYQDFTGDVSVSGAFKSQEIVLSP